MNLLIHILKYKLLLFMKTNTRVSFSSLVRSTLISLVYILFAYAFFLFTKSTVAYLMEVVRIGSFLLHRFIMLILFMFFISVNIGNIVVSFSTLFRSDETSFFFTKPVSFTKIFLIKFLDNFFYSSTTLLLIIAAALLGYGIYFHMGWTFYPLTLLLIFLPFMFTAGSLGVILLLIILRLSVRFGLRKVIIVSAFIYAGWIIGYYFIISPLALVREVFMYWPDINRYFGFLDSFLVKLFPAYWVADSLFWITTGSIKNALPLIALNFGVSSTLFSIALLAARKWYYDTWAASLELSSPSLVVKDKTKRTVMSFENRSGLNSIDEGIIKREFLLFIREPGQWIHLGVMVFLMVIFMTGISGIKIIVDESYYNDSLRTIIFLVVSLFSVFMVAALSLRFIFPLISLEGESVWKIRSSPIDHRPFLIKKLLIYFTLIFLMGQLVSFFAGHQFPKMLSFMGQINTVFITISVVSLNFGMGGYFANFKEKNPIRIASSQGASITFLFTIVYMVVILVLLFIPVSNYFESEHVTISAPMTGLIGSSLVLFILSIAISFVFIRLGLKSFTRDN